jgi:hypothetical protein
MTQADKAEMTWGDRDRKRGWTVRIQVGAEVIQRHLGNTPARDAEEAAIRSLAVAAAKDDGYALDPARVEIHRA